MPVRAAPIGFVAEASRAKQIDEIRHGARAGGRVAMILVPGIVLFLPRLAGYEG